jgi:hypothetical protein
MGQEKGRIEQSPARHVPSADIAAATAPILHSDAKQACMCGWYLYTGQTCIRVPYSVFPGKSRKRDAGKTCPKVDVVGDKLGSGDHIRFLFFSKLHRGTA